MTAFEGEGGETDKGLKALTDEAVAEFISDRDIFFSTTFGCSLLAGISCMVTVFLWATVLLTAKVLVFWEVVAFEVEVEVEVEAEAVEEEEASAVEAVWDLQTGRLTVDFAPSERSKKVLYEKKTPTLTEIRHN